VPVGGCRMKVYDHPSDGLRDALRLAEGMTYKWAVLNLPFGGGKSVLAIPRPLDREARQGLLRRFAELLNTLRGAYGTGEDMGTTPDDMGFLASITPHVKGGDPRTGGPTDPGPYTALGVFESIRAAMEHLEGSVDLTGVSVLVEGVGDVGQPLARMLADFGATLLLADLDEERVSVLAEELGAAVVPAGDVVDKQCDVYAPCAVGGTLNQETIPRLRCRAVAGSANNQLASDADGAALHARGILYAPDYVANGGGALAFGLLATGETDPEVLKERVAGIGGTLRSIFSEASEAGIRPEEAAARLARRNLSLAGDGEA
jgi:leucine dehydrogenase